MKLSGRYFLIFSAAFVAGCYVHEVGHAAFGWLEGVAVFPTPAKEYVLQAQLDWSKYVWVALGGPVGTTLAALAATAYYGCNPSLDSEAILAGAFAPPGIYDLFFLLRGRGHGREWQAAQTALGLRPAGHAMDIFFLCLSVAAFVVWAIRGGALWNTGGATKSRLPWLWSLLRLGTMAVAGFVLILVLQSSNNAVFDHVFRNARVVNVPAGIDYP